MKFRSLFIYLRPLEAQIHALILQKYFSLRPKSTSKVHTLSDTKNFYLVLIKCAPTIVHLMMLRKRSIISDLDEWVMKLRRNIKKLFK